MANTQTATLAHYEWLIERRSQNQRTSLKLYREMERLREAKMEGHDLAEEAVNLVAVSFSLWRAVFLCAEAPYNEHEVFEDARVFIETVVADNFIAYPQDKRAREWSAYYYLNNAQFRLESISEETPALLMGFKKQGHIVAMDSFNRIQAALDTAVDNLAKLITKALQQSCS